MEAIGSLGIDLKGLIAQMVNFTLLLVLLYLFLYKPVLRALEDRRARIRESMERAEEIKQQLARTQEDYAAQMQQARRDAQEVVAQAVELGKRLEEEARTRAKEEAERLLARAQAQIEREKQHAIAALRAEVADLAILAASRIVRRSLDTQDHYQIVREVLAETDKLKVD